MDNCKRLASKAGDELLQTISTLEELCIARERDKMSFSKYRRLAAELKDLSKLMALYNGHLVDNHSAGNSFE